MKLGKNEKKILVSLLKKYKEGEKYGNLIFEGKSISILAEEIYNEPIRDEVLYEDGLINKVKASLTRSLNNLWRKGLVYKGKPIYSRYWEKKHVEYFGYGNEEISGRMSKKLETIDLYKYKDFDNMTFNWVIAYCQEPHKQIDYIPEWAQLPSKTKIWWVLTEKGKENAEKLRTGNKIEKEKKNEALPKKEVYVIVKDSYTILGVNRNASDQEIKIAYKRLAKKYHPDYNKSPNAQEQFIELNNAYTELTKQEPPSIMDLMNNLMNSVFGSGFRDWDVNKEDFNVPSRKADEGLDDFFDKLYNSEEYKLYSWAINKMDLLNKLYFKVKIDLPFKYTNWKFEEEPDLKPIVLKGINNVIKHFKRVLNNEVDIKERIPNPINPIKDKTKRTSIPFYQKLLYDLRNQYHPKFINKFPEKYQSFIYEKIREMIIRLEKELKKGNF